MMYPVNTLFINPNDFKGRVLECRNDECLIEWTDEAGREWYTYQEINHILEEYKFMYIEEPFCFDEELFTL